MDVEYDQLYWVNARDLLAALMEHFPRVHECVWRRCCELGFLSKMLDAHLKGYLLTLAHRWMVDQLFTHQRMDLIEHFIGYVASWNRKLKDYHEYVTGQGVPTTEMPESMLLWAQIGMRVLTLDCETAADAVGRVWRERAGQGLAFEMREPTDAYRRWFYEFYVPGCVRIVEQHEMKREKKE
jgi:uncharacterized membrane protein YpjA